jgi:hypothetical protein
VTAAELPTRDALLTLLEEYDDDLLAAYERGLLERVNMTPAGVGVPITL